MCFRRACSRSLSAVPGPRRFTILNPRPSHQTIVANRPAAFRLASSHGPILHPPGRVVNFHTVCALVVATVLDVYSPTAATHGNPMNGTLSRAGVPPPAISRPLRDDLGGSSLHGTTKVAALLCLVV